MKLKMIAFFVVNCLFVILISFAKKEKAVLPVPYNYVGGSYSIASIANYLEWVRVDQQDVCTEQTGNVCTIYLQIDNGIGNNPNHLEFDDYINDLIDSQDNQESVYPAIIKMTGE